MKWLRLKRRQDGLQESITGQDPVVCGIMLGIKSA